MTRTLMTHTDRRTLIRPALLLALTLAFAAAGASNAFGITRDEVLARAQRRVDAPVPYSQSAYYAGYRTDCSGYVSMCWATGTSWATSSFYRVTHPIAVADLLPGDALLKPGYHIRLFYGWLDDAHTTYIAYESAYGRIAGVRLHSIAEDLAFGYRPVRYDRIANSPRARNVLRNGSFNTWPRAWSEAAEQPAWWTASGTEWWESPALRRTDAYRSARNSLELVNESEDPAVFTEIAQTVPIVARAPYRLTAWARTAADPRRVELRLAYLDADGASVAETWTTGDRRGLSADVFAWMSLLETAPAEAVRARVSVRLFGSEASAEPSAVAPPASVLLDEISLFRPQVTTTIAQSRTSAVAGNTVVLTGAVAPARAVGTPATLWVLRPGGSWTRLSDASVTASGSGGAWRRTFTFTRGMVRGAYRFRVTIPAVPGYLGVTSPSVAVTMR